MKFIDLFAGIGGFRLGFEMAGHECVGFCEFDKFAVASYTAMHLATPEQLEYLAGLSDHQRKKEIAKEEYRNGEWFRPDISGIRADEIPKSDCWCFGFPCQDISIAGKQSGFSGKRSSLFFTVTGLIRQIEEKERPSYLLIENVKNLLSVNGGHDFLKLLVELDEIGYDCEWQIINSSDYVPQNRERVFIVGHFRGRCTSTVFPIKRTNRENYIKQIGEDGSVKRKNPQTFRTYDPTGLAPCLGTKGGGNLEPHIVLPVGGIKVAAYTKDSKVKDRTRILDVSGISQAVRATDYKDPIKIAIPVLTPDRATKRQNGRRVKEDGEPMFTLTSQDRHGVMVQISEELMVYAIWVEKYNCYMAIRKLTPLECFRLQGFPDDYFERAALINSNSQLYKQAGNSVTVPVIYEIAKRMEREE